VAKSRKPTPIYWDACCFISILSNETNAKDCLKVVKAAADGHLVIVTSAISLVEVIKLDGKKPIAEDDQAKVDAAMLGPHFSIREVDRTVAQLARRLIWDHGVAVKDSIHVATALDTNAVEMHTTDNELLGLSPLCINGTELLITKPDWLDPDSPEAQGHMSLFAQDDSPEVLGPPPPI
jgi:predicted nucleic acid-binding protein